MTAGYREDPQGRQRWSENGNWTRHVLDGSGSPDIDHDIPSTGTPLTGDVRPNTAPPPRAQDDGPLYGSSEWVAQHGYDATRARSQAPSGLGSGLSAVSLGPVLLLGVLAVLTIGIMALAYVLRVPLMIAMWAAPVAGIVWMVKRGFSPLRLGAVMLATMTLAYVASLGESFGQGMKENAERRDTARQQELGKSSAYNAARLRELLGGLRNGPVLFCNTLDRKAEEALAASAGVPAGLGACRSAMRKRIAAFGPADYQKLSRLEVAYAGEAPDNMGHVFRLGPNPLGWTRVHTAWSTYSTHINKIE
ncbi:hypothetical protein ACQEU3_15195 [Spirillospora sp. CA-253888]